MRYIYSYKYDIFSLACFGHRFHKSFTKILKIAKENNAMSVKHCLQVDFTSVDSLLKQLGRVL